ncbi:inorganic triphosphatase [Pantoea sp. 1.19]|uniref:CYTH domain-containing protein n=1 Tax=Pantoea sp. 1.19 TaxID=1925589 RepID=UPI000948B001|nr:inorganic triphosphatase [Pantoea sp. 1.19]
MTVEIEVKFIANATAAAALPDLLSRWPHQTCPPQALSNIYYETADKQLRRWDMGLRIRGWDQQYEMTLKTAGDTVGGLHQRAEYNVSLSAPALDVALLPADVWPSGTDVSALQQALTPLFSTHFTREKWLVTYRDSQIEVAFDRGEVAAGERREPLSEIELELKSGQRDALLAFAAELAAQPGLRLGSESKAARGYWLAQGAPRRESRPFPTLLPAAKSTVEEGMRDALLLALSHWQYHEALWLQGEAAARDGVIAALEAMRQTFTLCGALVPRKANARLREALSELETRLTAPDATAEATVCSPVSVQAQLALTHWLVSASWRDYCDEKARTRLAGSWKRFADIMLGRLAADLKEAFQRVPTLAALRDKQPRLTRQLLTLRLLAGAYPPAAVAGWLEPWQQLAQAISDGDEPMALYTSQQALKQAAFWKNGSH